MGMAARARCGTEDVARALAERRSGYVDGSQAFWFFAATRDVEGGLVVLVPLRPVPQLDQRAARLGALGQHARAHGGATRAAEVRRAVRQPGEPAGDRRALRRAAATALTAFQQGSHSLSTGGCGQL